MNHSRAEDTAPRAMQTAAIKQAEGEGEGEGWGRGREVGEKQRRGGEERAKRVWEEEREKDGLEEENRIKRIQMEERETDRRTDTDTHTNTITETNKQKCTQDDIEKHTLHMNQSPLQIHSQHANVVVRLNLQSNHKCWT